MNFPPVVRYLVDISSFCSLFLLLPLLPFSLLIPLYIQTVHGVDSTICLLDKEPRLSWGRVRFPGSKVFLTAFVRPWRPPLPFIWDVFEKPVYASRSLMKIAREAELAFDPAHLSFSEQLICCLSVTQIPKSGLYMAVQIHHLHLRPFFFFFF